MRKWLRCDGGHEDVGPTIIARVDAPPVFEASEQVFDLVALRVELFVEVSGHRSSLSWRDPRG